jgi:hypothetical protein
VEDLAVASPAKGVRLGKNLFGSDLEQEIEELSGQTVLGIIEPVEIKDIGGLAHTISAKIDTGAWRTTIDEALAKEWGLNTIIDHGHVRGALGRQRRPIIELAMTLRDKHIKTQAYLADRSHMNYPMIVGRRDLKGFLVDPSQKAR